MSANNNRAGFRVFDVEDQDDADPTEENMPKKLSERIPFNQVLLWDVPAMILISWVAVPAFQIFVLGVHNPPGITPTHGGFLALVFMLWVIGFGSFGLIMLLIHLIALLIHKKAQREEIINWGVRGWVRPGLEPDEEMLEEIRRRRPYRPNQRR